MTEVELLLHRDNCRSFPGIAKPLWMTSRCRPLGRAGSLAAASALILAGCTHTDPVVFYTPSPGIAAADTLTIVGSLRQESWLSYNEVGFVTAVDGYPIEKPQKYWDEPVLLRPFQTHQVTLAYVRNQSFAATNAVIEAQGPQQATVRFAVADDQTVELWLEESGSGAALTPHLLAHILAPSIRFQTFFFPRGK